MSKKTKAEFFKLCLGTLPDELYQESVPVEKWLDLAETTDDATGFPPNSLNKLVPLDPDVEWERIFGISLYMVGNVLPFAVPLLGVASIFRTHARYALLFVFVYVGFLFLVENYYYKPKFLKRYHRDGALTDNIKDNQYLYTERNSSKYLNTTLVWPKSVNPPQLSERTVIFCIIPHGVAPFGVTAYPIWSKIWSSKLCHWTCAPVVLKLPFIGWFMAKIGYIPAKAQNIHKTLHEKQESVGVFLDGIDGMFCVSGNEERGVLKQRKGIVKIALRAGVPIIPVYGFGHSALYTVWVDPFGILKFLSNQLQMALTPFFGRYYWFLGPPRRIAVTLCLGDPIECPQIAEPTKEDIDKYHALMVSGFKTVFDTHKGAYGWENKRLKIV